jgi:hypothetical protein
VDVGIVEYGRVFSSGASVVPADANIVPFVGGMLIQCREDVDELPMQDFLQGDDPVSCSVELKACDKVVATIHPRRFLLPGQSPASAWMRTFCGPTGVFIQS